MSIPASKFQRHLEYAYRLAIHSPDLSTQNGAVIIDRDGTIIGEGCNTLPFGVSIKPERLERPVKYAFTEHAERNAIYDAAKRGNRLWGATMFCPWFACADCGRAIIQSGIKYVVGHKKMFDETPDRWKGSIAASFEMFKEAGIWVHLYEGSIEAPEIRFNESLWKP